MQNWESFKSFYFLPIFEKVETDGFLCYVYEIDISAHVSSLLFTVWKVHAKVKFS